MQRYIQISLFTLIIKKKRKLFSKFELKLPTAIRLIWTNDAFSRHRHLASYFLIFSYDLQLKVFWSNPWRLDPYVLAILSCRSISSRRCQTDCHRKMVENRPTFRRSEHRAPTSQPLYCVLCSELFLAPNILVCRTESTFCNRDFR